MPMFQPGDSSLPSTGKHLDSKASGLQPGYKDSTTLMTELYKAIMASLHTIKIQELKKQKIELFQGHS